MMPARRGFATVLARLASTSEVMSGSALGSEWDDAIDAFSTSPPSPPVEHVLWTPYEGERTAHAIVKPHPYGQVLVFTVNSSLLRSELFRDERGVALGELAESKRLEFLAKSWTS